MAVYLPRSTVSEYMRIDWETVGRCVHRTLNEIEPERSSKGTVYLSPCTFKLEHQLPAKEKRTDPDGKVTEIRYTCEEIIRTLRGMRVTAVSDTGYVPSYTRTTLTDALHELVGFRTDYEVIRRKQMQGNVRKSKGL